MKINRHVPRKLFAAAIVFFVGTVVDVSDAAPVTITNGAVIKNATIVDTRDGSLMPGMSIVVGQGKILRITREAVRTGRNAETVDAAGKYVVPGYYDMHDHSIEGADLNPTFWPLMIANGVTAFREETTTPASIQRGEKLNTDRAAGRVDAPEVIFHGREAHLNLALSARDSSNMGLPSIDHLGAGIGVLLDCSTDEDAIRAAVLAQGFKGPFPGRNFIDNPRAYDGAKNAPLYQRVLDTYGESKCIALSHVFVGNGTWQTPTLIRLRAQDYGNSPEFTSDPNLAYVDKKLVARWQESADRFATLPGSAVTTLQKYYELQKHVTSLMKRNGVKMMTGSDHGGGWLVAGFALHQEFHQLAEAGLSPLEVLQMTTLNPAEFLERTETAGRVAEGKNADLIVLDANPIADVAHLDKIYGVFLRGKYFSRATLKRMLEEVAAAYR